MRQLPLPFSTSEPRVAQLLEAPPVEAGIVLAARLTTLLRESVEVELTDNAWTMVSYRRVSGRLRFRLHHMFARAQEPVMRALAGFTGRNRRAHGRVIDDYVRQHKNLIRQVTPRIEA